MNSLLGLDLPAYANFIIAFVFVLLLIGGAAWLVRRFGAARLDPAARGRQPRLAVVDAASIDGRRKLVIVRRDNAEHLLMIGGPTDVVVETNIVRAGPLAARDTAPARNGSEPALRAVPEPAQWQPPEPAPLPAPVMRTERAAPRVVADDSWHTPDEAIASPAVQAPPVIHTPPPAPVAPPVRAVRPAETLASLAQELSRPQAELAPPPRIVQPEPAPILAAIPAPVAPAPIPAPMASVPQPAAPPPDQSLAEMAQRLEAALRRPAGPRAVADAAASRAAVAADAKAPVAPVRQQRVVVGAQPKSNAQPAAAQPNNLEQEMASLLNKPGKT